MKSEQPFDKLLTEVSKAAREAVRAELASILAPLLRRAIHEIIEELQPSPHREYMRPNYAAPYLGISESWLEKQRQDGTGPRYLRVGDMILYPRKALDDYMASLPDVRETDLHLAKYEYRSPLSMTYALTVEAQTKYFVISWRGRPS